MPPSPEPRRCAGTASRSLRRIAFTSRCRIRAGSTSGLGSRQPPSRFRSTAARLPDAPSVRLKSRLRGERLRTRRVPAGRGLLDVSASALPLPSVCSPTRLADQAARSPGAPPDRAGCCGRCAVVPGAGLAPSRAAHALPSAERQPGRVDGRARRSVRIATRCTRPRTRHRARRARRSFGLRVAVARHDETIPRQSAASSPCDSATNWSTSRAWQPHRWLLPSAFEAGPVPLRLLSRSVPSLATPPSQFWGNCLPKTGMAVPNRFGRPLPGVRIQREGGTSQQGMPPS